MDSQIFACQLARCRSAEGAALCPSDMMLCVISYWVILSGAKRRQIQQLRCCVLPRQNVETEECLLSKEVNLEERTPRTVADVKEMLVRYHDPCRAGSPSEPVCSGRLRKTAEIANDFVKKRLVLFGTANFGRGDKERLGRSKNGCLTSDCMESILDQEI